MITKVSEESEKILQELSEFGFECPRCGRSGIESAPDSISKAYELGLVDGRLMTSPWVPVSERLPENGDGVLTWDDGNYVIGYCYVWPTFTNPVGLRWDQGCFYHEGDEYEVKYRPTHWMPLPKEPQGESK